MQLPFPQFFSCGCTYKCTFCCPYCDTLETKFPFKIRAFSWLQEKQKHMSMKRHKPCSSQLYPQQSKIGNNQRSADRRMGKRTMVYLYDGMLLSNEKGPLILQ